MKIKHHTLISKNNISDNKLDWNKLRSSSSEVDYFIPKQKDNYIKLIESLGPPNPLLFNHLKNYIKTENIKRVISIGAGRSVLEYHLKKELNLEIIVTDSDKSINILKDYKIFDNVYLLDPSIDIFPFKVTNDTIFLLSRIDTEFDDIQLKNLFKILSINNVKHISFIPASILNYKTLLVEFKILIISIIFKRYRIFCGYSRTKSTFFNIWSDFYHTNDKNINLITFLRKI
jgi:hypothetical protein